MNVDPLVPALAAAGGGGSLLMGIYAFEHRRESAMRAGRVRLAMRFPVGVDARAAQTALGSLSGLDWRSELVMATVASSDGIEHHLLVPAGVRSSVEASLSAAMPGLRLRPAEIPAGHATAALRLSVPAEVLLREDDVEATSRALLAGLAVLRSGELVVVAWALRPARPTPPATPETKHATERERGRRLRARCILPGFDVAGVVLVKAADRPRARRLLGQVVDVVRSRRTDIASIRGSVVPRACPMSVVPKTGRRSGWLSVPEMLPLISWPLGEQPIPGVEVGSTRELLVPRQVPRTGRRLLVGRGASGERPAALSRESIRHHLAVIGPSGSGKSSLIAASVLSDLAAGLGGVVFDPKGPDLIETILSRIPSKDADRVVVIDPGDTSRPVPGVALLQGGDRDLQAEVLTGALRSIFADAWGVRSDHFVRLAVRSLAEVPGGTLADMGRLFFDEPFRRAALARLRDPYLLAAWQEYERLPAGSKTEHVQAPMNRVMALLSRPAVRAVLASREPKLDIGRLLAERKWLLVSLSPGQIGEASAGVIATGLLYAVWAAIEARSALPAEKRHLVALYIDELASLASALPFSFELLAERARGLGAGLTVAMQTLGRIPEPTRSALLGNAASLISFRASAEEAPRIARQLPGLSEADVMGLGCFEVAARIGTGLGSSVAVVTGRTEPLPPPTGNATAIREMSSLRYGSPPEDTETPKTVAPPDEPESGPDARPGRTARTS